MILRTGTVDTRQPWRMLEVSINQEPDILASRILRAIKHYHEKMEVFVPFISNTNGTPEWIVEHVYVRGANGSLPLLRRIPGIECVRPETVTNEWIQSLLQRAYTGSALVQQGDFVRVLSGPCGMMCGEITNLNGTATVQIALRTKTITLHTYLENLQVLRVPSDRREFFYQPSFFS